jgi:hypothetical protein
VIIVRPTPAALGARLSARAGIAGTATSTSVFLRRLTPFLARCATERLGRTKKMVIVPACQRVTRLLAAALTLTAILAATAPSRIHAQSDRARSALTDPAAGTPGLVAESGGNGASSVAAADQEKRNPVQISDADHRGASSPKRAADTTDRDGRAFIFGLLIVEFAAHAPVARLK